MTEIPEIAVDELIDLHEVLLFDAYGVLMDSSGALSGAVELIARLNQAGKRYYILTNDSTRLPSTSAARYRSFGLDIHVDRVVSSGSLLENHFQAHSLAGAECVVLGTGDTARYVEEAGGRVVPPDERFDVLVIGGVSGFPFVETVDSVLNTAFRQLDEGAKPHLVVMNPDVLYPRGNGRFGIAAGSIAVVLESALNLRYPDRGDVLCARLGKPYAPIFQEAERRSGSRDMIMVGDQVETDIRGANDFGIESVLIETGVTGPSIAALPPNLRPSYRMRSLAAPPG